MDPKVQKHPSMECEVKDFLGTLYFQISDQPEKRTKILKDM